MVYRSVCLIGIYFFHPLEQKLHEGGDSVLFIVLCFLLGDSR